MAHKGEVQKARIIFLLFYLQEFGYFGFQQILQAFAQGVLLLPLLLTVLWHAQQDSFPGNFVL